MVWKLYGRAERHSITNSPCTPEMSQVYKNECLGRDASRNSAGTETEYGENPCRSTAGWGAGGQVGGRRIGSGRPWAQWRANPFDYLAELQRHSEDLKRRPSEWMPWNYRDSPDPPPRNIMNLPGRKGSSAAMVR
jgi:hypothetical protein